MSAEFVLGPKAVRAGYELRHLQSTPSTNSHALEFSIEALSRAGKHEGMAPGIWFVADRQTMGRGRQGRRWIWHEGNLAASLLLILPSTVRAPQILSFVAANALADAVEPFLGGTGEELRLKWPNDLLLSGGKLAGILLEARTMGNGCRAVALGFGLNVKGAPENISYPVASLAGFGCDADRHCLFRALGESWHENYCLWNDGHGTARVLSRWRNRAHGLGGAVRIEGPGKAVEGIFLDIDGDGHLILLQNDGQRTHVASGDVSFSDVDRPDGRFGKGER